MRFKTKKSVNLHTQKRIRVGAELYFYKCQSEKARSFLAPLLAQKGERSFASYVQNREKRERYFDGSYERINRIISICNVDLGELNIRDFDLVINWIYHYTIPEEDERRSGGIEHWAKIEELHANCGFDLIYTIDCKHGVRAFLNVLNTYEYTINPSNDWSLSMSASKLRSFLNFMHYYSNEMWRLIEIGYENNTGDDTIATDYSYLKGVELYDLAIKTITKERNKILEVFNNMRKVDNFTNKFPDKELPDELDDLEPEFDFMQYANQAYHGFHANVLLKNLEGVNGIIKAHHSC